MVFGRNSMVRCKNNGKSYQMNGKNYHYNVTRMVKERIMVRINGLRNVQQMVQLTSMVDTECHSDVMVPVDFQIQYSNDQMLLMVLRSQDIPLSASCISFMK